MKFILISFLSFIIFKADSQETKQLIISDSETKTPIPFASVYCKQKQIGGYSDENGKFTISSNIATNDTLLISSVGYHADYLIYKNLSVDFPLKRLTNTLKSVTITPKGGEIILGSLKLSSHFVINLNQFKVRSELCLLMPNLERKNGKITSVSFYINESGKPNTPFRIRIYSSKDGKPLDDLLLSNVVVHSSNKGGWLEVNLEKFNIPFQNEGLFVSMESLYGIKKSSFYKTIDLSTGKASFSYGQSLGLTEEFLNPTSYQRQFGADWVPFKTTFPINISQKSFYPMIRAKIKLDE